MFRRTQKKASIFTTTAYVRTTQVALGTTVCVRDNRNGSDSVRRMFPLRPRLYDEAWANNLIIPTAFQQKKWCYVFTFVLKCKDYEADTICGGFVGLNIGVPLSGEKPRYGMYVHARKEYGNT